MKYVPMKHQKIAYDFCMQHEHAGLFLSMGLGKTVTVLTVITTLMWDLFTVRRTLVVAPKNVAQNVWAQECAKWDHLQNLRCSVILGTEKQRMAALEADADIYIINRENVVWLLEVLKGRLPFDAVVLDELSSYKSTGAKRWKALKKAIQSVRYVYGLTGTPAPNGYLDLWPQVYLLDGGERLGKRVTDYRQRYFTAGAHKGNVVYEWRPRIGAQDAINRKLSDLCLSMSAEDWLDLPPVIYNTIPVSMTKSARKDYETLKRDKVLPLLREGAITKRLDPMKPEELRQMTSAIRGDTAATVAGKLMQMANGAVYDDEQGVLHIHDEKLDALAEIHDTNPGQSLLVFYGYKHDKDRILARFPDAVEFTGPDVLERWNRGEIGMLLCHPASTGHGLNLQAGGHITVWFGLTWSLELYQQANARLSRPGQKQTVVIHHIVCRDTIDERVMDALHTKDEGQSALLTALKGYLNKKGD